MRGNKREKCALTCCRQRGLWTSGHGPSGSVWALGSVADRDDFNDVTPDPVSYQVGGNGCELAASAPDGASSIRRV